MYIFTNAKKTAQKLFAKIEDKNLKQSKKCLSLIRKSVSIKELQN